MSIRFSQKQTRASLMSLGITVLILPNSEVSVTSYFFYWCYPWYYHQCQKISGYTNTALSPVVHDGGLKGGSSEALTGPAWRLLVSMAERKLMIEVSEVLMLESSADDTQKWKNNKRGESSKRHPVSKVILWPGNTGGTNTPNKYSANPSHNFSSARHLARSQAMCCYALCSTHSEVCVQFDFIDIKEHLGVYTQWLYKTHWNGRHFKNQTKKKKSVYITWNCHNCFETVWLCTAFKTHLQMQ